VSSSLRTDWQVAYVLARLTGLVDAPLWPRRFALKPRLKVRGGECHTEVDIDEQALGENPPAHINVVVGQVALLQVGTDESSRGAPPRRVFHRPVGWSLQSQASLAAVTACAQSWGHRLCCSTLRFFPQQGHGVRCLVEWVGGHQRRDETLWVWLDVLSL